MQACPGDDTITLMVCGQLDGTRVSAVESHVDECASCRKVIGVLRVAMSTRGGDALRANAIGLLSPGTLVGRYRIVDLLGAGGMGVVYAAHDPELERNVALKLLYPTLSPGGDDELASRLRHESKVMAKLRHPNVATVHDLGSYRDQLFLVMELVEGETLRAWVGRDMPWTTVVATFAQAGKGLAAAHEAGIVHCDFKPDNVLLDATGRPLITDFGLAHVAASTRPSARDLHTQAAVDASALVTVSGGPVFGTPAYMAPERFAAEVPADAQGDVFAFCVALYEVLYGRRPFEGATVEELRAAIAAPPASPDHATSPPWLHAAIARGLAADRDVRYRSMTELLAALEPAPRRARSRWLAPAALVGLAATGAIAWTALRAHAAAAPTSCNARADLANVWDDGVRDRIRTAWTATPEGKLAWPRLEHALDGYADMWVATSDATCKAPPASASVAEFQNRCLRGIETDLRSFIDQLADTSLIATADRKVGSLPSIQDCTSSAPHPPEPSDVWTTFEVDRLRDEISAAVGQSIAGKFTAAGAWLDAIAARADMVGFKPLIAEIQYERAMNMRGAAIKPELRAAAMRNAAAQAEASGDEPLAANAWLGLAFEAGEINSDFARGHEYVSYARAADERLGGDVRIESQIALENGKLFWHEHKLDDARREYDRVAKLAQANPVFYLEAISGLALVDNAAGRYAQALDEEQMVLAQRRKLYGDVHPSIVQSYTNLGDTTDRMGRLEESLDYYKKADAIAQQVWGADHPNVQITAHNLGGIYGDLERLDDAQHEFERAVRIGRATLGPDSPRTVKSETSLAMALLDRKRYDEALGLLRHALKVDLATYGAQGPETVIAYDDLGIGLRVAGKLDEALVYADKAVTGTVALDGGENTADVAQAYDAKARTLAVMHRSRDAAAAFDKSADIYAHTEASPKKATDEQARAALARAGKPIAD
ncbi:MAG TPA: serine/threonine-protein kinase [Kofleriaceae bacterium]